jgi:hypothetical protein
MLIRPKFIRIEDSPLDEEDVQRLLKRHGGDPLRKLTSDYYVVFSIRFGDVVEYGLDFEPEGSLPVFYQSELFDVIDDRVSQYWVFAPRLPKKIDGNERSAMLAISDWAHNRKFFDQLVNSDQEAWKIWRKYKSLMEMEFATPGIVRKAEIVGDGWVLCAECINGWKIDTHHEMVKCPSCGTVQIVDRTSLYRFRK